jgi:hypothetical protein
MAYITNTSRGMRIPLQGMRYAKSMTTGSVNDMLKNYPGGRLEGHIRNIDGTWDLSGAHIGFQNRNNVRTIWNF